MSIMEFLHSHSGEREAALNIKGGIGYCFAGPSPLGRRCRATGKYSRVPSIAVPDTGAIEFIGIHTLSL